jgi:hypothetical protein
LEEDKPSPESYTSLETTMLRTSIARGTVLLLENLALVLV